MLKGSNFPSITCKLISKFALMFKKLKHFFRLIKRVFIIDVIKYYWIVILKSKTSKAYSIRLYNGLKIKIAPNAGDYCTFHEVEKGQEHEVLNPQNELG